MALIKSGPPAVALIRALGVTDTKNVRRVTLNVEAGKVATLEVERFLDGGATTQLQRLQLRTELAPEQLSEEVDHKGPQV